MQPSSVVPPATLDGLRRYHPYKLPVIGALGLAEILSWVLIGTGFNFLNDLGVVLFLGVLAVAFILDGTGVVTLRGRVFTSLSRGVQIVIAVVFFGLFLVWIIPYLIVAALDFFRTNGQSQMSSITKAAEQQKRIATLEGSLGMLPSEEGVCAKCHKPLQLGAEYCAYCGTAVAPPLQVCPVCHAHTFPDAKWCPECGAALTPGGTQRNEVKRP